MSHQTDNFFWVEICTLNDGTKQIPLWQWKKNRWFKILSNQNNCKANQYTNSKAMIIGVRDLSLRRCSNTSLSNSWFTGYNCDRWHNALKPRPMFLVSLHFLVLCCATSIIPSDCILRFCKLWLVVCAKVHAIIRCTHISTVKFEADISLCHRTFFTRKIASI